MATGEFAEVDGSAVAGSLTRIRSELASMRTALAQIERELASIEEPPSRAPARIRSARYYEVLVEVYERGPHGVSGEQLDELAKSHGYDRRGLNGYFAGVRAPLRRHSGRVHLTLEGRRLVNEWLHNQAATRPTREIGT